MEQNKVLVIGDLHLGYRTLFIESSIERLKAFNENYTNVINDIAEKIKTYTGKAVVLAGDIIETNFRLYDNNNLITITEAIKEFLERDLTNHKVYFIIGNHDLYKKDFKGIFSTYEWYNFNFSNYQTTRLIDHNEIFVDHDLEIVLGGYRINFKKYPELKDLHKKYIYILHYHLSEQDHQVPEYIISHKLIIPHFHNPFSVIRNNQPSRKVFYMGSIVPFSFNDAFKEDNIKHLQKLYFTFGILNILEKNKLQSIPTKNKILFVKFKTNRQIELPTIKDKIIFLEIECDFNTYMKIKHLKKENFFIRFKLISSHTKHTTDMQSLYKISDRRKQFIEYLCTYASEQFSVSKEIIKDLIQPDTSFTTEKVSASIEDD